MQLEVIDPTRVRKPCGPYGWVDLRIATEGHLERLGSHAALVYLFLCTVGNRTGVSFWSHDRMARAVGLPRNAVQSLLEQLVTANLIVCSGRFTQVLPLPDSIRPGQDSSVSGPTTPVATPVPVPLVGKLPLAPAIQLPIEGGVLHTVRELDPARRMRPEAPPSTMVVDASPRVVDLDEDEIRVHNDEARSRLVKITGRAPGSESIRRVARALALDARKAAGDHRG